MAELENRPTLVLDFSRTVSRIGRGHPTGIDRVERAYIEHFLHHPHPILFMARLRGEVVLLDQQKMRGVFALIKNDGPWGASIVADILRRPKRRKTAAITRTLRSVSFSGRRLATMLRKHVPVGFTYLNVGHGRLHPKLWKDLRRGGAKTITIIIHDLIPLDFPQYTTTESTRRFRDQMRAVSKHADKFIFNSTDTKNRMRHWQRHWEHNETDGHVALLGTEPLPRTNMSANVTHPYFVCLGTIEPRKNHKLLLNIWADFHRTLSRHEIPHLHIVGARGWLNSDVFTVLDTAAFMGTTVFEHQRMPDNDLGKLLNDASGLLFPSFAEGFGCPLVEALQMQVPVICSELVCFHEIAGEIPTYIDPKNQQVWHEQILELASPSASTERSMKIPPELPKWKVHFNIVEAILAEY